MTRFQMINNIKNRLLEEYNLNVPIRTIENIIKIEEDEIYQVIATMDEFRYQWGRIGGKEKAPKRSFGMYTELDTIRAQGGYTNWKLGYPYVKWTKAALLCEVKTAEEYFNLPEHRYTTAARDFRKFLNYPEIQEFEDLPEDKIVKICEKADKVELDKKYTPGKQAELIRRRQQNKINLNALHDRWKELGYKPMGALDWDGPQNDTINYMLERYVNHEDDIVQKLEMIRHVRDMAEYKGQIAAHYQELKELEEEALAEVQKQGLTEVEHKNITDKSSGFHLRLKAEKDPWGLDNIFKLTRKEIVEKNRKITEEFYEQLELEQKLAKESKEKEDNNSVDDSENTEDPDNG